MTTPAWQAAENGPPGELTATNQSAQINQLLAAHGISSVYQGKQILTPTGAQNFQWSTPGNTTDLSQPFTMSGTAIGRITIPLQPNGNGAQVLVSLYTDTGGSPNIAAGALASTLVPAAYLNQVCAPTGLVNGPELATPANNTVYMQNGLVTYPFVAPSTSISDSYGAGSVCVDTSAGFFIVSGGLNNTSNDAITNVYTNQNLGGGVLGAPVLQPPLPQGTFAHTMTLVNGTTIVVAGGTIGNLTTDTTTVWVASWDSANNQVGSWTSQTALPVTLNSAAGASWGNYVYYIGGITTTAGQGTNACYVAELNNGQLGSWTQTTPLPSPTGIFGAIAYAVNGFLYCLGGNAAVGSYTNTYYTNINSDGTLGTWQNGPPLFSAVDNGGVDGLSSAQIDDIILTLGSSPAFTNVTQSIAVSSNGPGPSWQQTLWSGSNPVQVLEPRILLQATQNGSYDMIVIDLNDTPSVYWYTTLSAVPMVSIPLAVSGLTNGSTYHVVLRQFSSTSDSDYVAFGILDGTPLPDAALTHGRYASGAWASVSAAHSIPMSVFDQTASGPIWHTWQDASATNQQSTAASWTTTLYSNNTELPTGTAEMTTFPNVPLNSNPTFTSGVIPWTATNGTITQSSAQTHGGFPSSGLLTPTGGFAQASANSELVPVSAGFGPYQGVSQWYEVTGWFYTPTTWANFSLSVSWYDSSQTLISTSSNTASLTGATWTQVTHYYLAPSGCAFAKIQPTMSGTPAASNTLYSSDVYVISSPETVPSLTSVASIAYPTAGSPWPPIGVTQLN